MRATGSGQRRTLDMLLAAKANPTICDRVGDNALHIAINGQHVNLCQTLMACSVAEEMMERENEEKQTPLNLIMKMHDSQSQLRETLKSLWLRRGVIDDE